MRNQQLLEAIADKIQSAKAAEFASLPNFRGGWEAWLQAEIWYAMYQIQTNTSMTREMPYPSGAGHGGLPYLSYTAATGVAAPCALAAAARCDFYIHRPGLMGAADESYVELKCISPTAVNPINDAWDRFGQDVRKIGALQTQNNALVCTAMLATYGTFLPGHVTGIAPDLGWYWAGNRSAYVLDFHTTGPRVSTLANVTTGGTPRLFIVAVSC